MTRPGAFDRRRFLGLAGATTVGAILAACDRAPASSSPTAPRVPTRADPVAWAVDETSLVPSGLDVERGATLRIYQWREYLYDDVLDAFARRYASADVDVHVESFSDMSEAIARLREPDADFDVFFPTIDVLGHLVGEGLLRPLNQDYLSNLPNLWPEFRSSDGPFYDRGARYTVPYTVYSSGIAWRTDLVDPRDATDPFGLPWNPRYRGRTGFLDQYREALALGLQREGVDDVNTIDATAIDAASQTLLEAVDAGAVVSQDGAYDALPEGELAAHQAWSGDALTALTYGDRSPREVGRTLAYWWPMDRTGWVGCDLTAVCARGRNPVLAHAFVNHLLDAGVAFRNFVWNGYQPPLEEITLERAVADYPGFAEMGHHCTILTPEQFAAGQMFHPLDPRSDARWIDAWERVLAAA
jgi:spermidine/putrescine transport system substrate-binding protein